MPEKKCPTCGCRVFYTKNPDDEFDIVEFECTPDGLRFSDEPGEVTENTEIYCNRCVGTTGSRRSAVTSREPLTKRRCQMDKWECPCGYVYDPAEGDAKNMIPAGTAFEDLPDDWVCPLCGAEKEYFEKVD